MPDETKKPQASDSKPAQANRPNNNRSNYKGRNNRHNNRPNNRPSHKVSEPKDNVFATEAKYHETKASYWRKRVNGFSAFTLIYGALSVSFDIHIAGPQAIMALILIAFALIFLIVHSARNYSEHKKQFVQNKLRRNILLTAEDMAKGTKDPISKEEYMLEALSAVGTGDKKA